MLHQTKGIVLRTVKYGETSLIATLYTELFGLQSYMVQGVRTDKKSSQKAAIFQPSHILELVVYHHPHKNLQRIKESRISYWYQQTHVDMVRHAIGVYCIELFTKVITEPEANPVLYEFLEQGLKLIDQKPLSALSNFSIYYSLQLATQLGFSIQEGYSPQQPILDLLNGQYVASGDLHSMEILEGPLAEIINEFIKLDRVAMEQIKLSSDQRLQLLQVIARFYKLPLPQMSALKSLDILHEIFQ